MSPSHSSALNVAVVGAGVMGAMTAWRLALRGVPVTLYERYAPAHDRGATGGDTRIFRSACKEGTTHVPLIRASLPLWHELSNASGNTLLTMTGVASIGRPDDASMRATLATARAFDLRLDVMASAQAAKRYPQFRIEQDEHLYLDPDGGVIRADLTVLAAISQAQKLGTDVRPYTKVQALRTDGSGVTLQTDDQEARYTHVVAAPGGWARNLPALADLPLVPRRIALSWFAASDIAPYADAQSLVMMHTYQGGYFNCFPSTDGATVKGSCNIGGWPAVDSADALPRSLPDAELAHLRQAAAQSLNGLHPDPVRIGIYVDAFTPDGEGLLGTLHPSGRLIVACGFSGHGFKFSPAIGEAAASLVTEGRSSLPVGHLDVHRYLQT